MSSFVTGAGARRSKKGKNKTKPSRKQQSLPKSMDACFTQIGSRPIVGGRRVYGPTGRLTLPPQRRPNILSPLFPLASFSFGATHETPIRHTPKHTQTAPSGCLGKGEDRAMFCDKLWTANSHAQIKGGVFGLHLQLGFSRLAPTPFGICQGLCKGSPRTAFRVSLWISTLSSGGFLGLSGLLCLLKGTLLAPLSFSHKPSKIPLPFLRLFGNQSTIKPKACPTQRKF